MAIREPITNAVAAASGGIAAIGSAVLLAVLFWLGAEWVMNALDLHVPVRQIATGRSLDALTLSARWLYWMAAGLLADTPGTYARRTA